jgi:hypothetical protein
MRAHRPPMWGDVDIGAEVLAAGGAARFLASSVDLHDVPALAAACNAQRSALRAASSALGDDAVSVRGAAYAQLATAQTRLDDATTRAAEAVSEHEARREKLQAIADAFQEHRAACAEDEAVKKCRVIADAYVDVLRTLSAHHKGSRATRDGMDSVAANIEVLIRQVDLVRRAGPRSLFGESLAINKRILASIENHCVDAVIKARAAFVNVMDNEFRAFGWPMKVPQVGANSDIIANVNFYVKQLNKLQNVAEQRNFVAQRTRWHSALSDSWAMAAILRAPLARFKYHFLENYRASTTTTGGNVGGEVDDDNVSSASSVVMEAEASVAADSAARSSTTRFDRPEWAAEFALARIFEAAPFLKEIVLDDTCTADLKYAEGYCKVFANKIAYDSDLAMRGPSNDGSADNLVSHAADTAAQFDVKIRTGIVANNPIFNADDQLPSSLDILSTNETFFSTWASSELRLAQLSVLESVHKLLEPGDASSVLKMAAVKSHATSLGTTVADPDVDVEMECAEIVERISQASRGCRGLESIERMLTFIRWTEIHLLEAVRSRLRDEFVECEWEPRTNEAVFRASRAGWIAHALARALENKSCDAFYVALEAEDGDEDRSGCVYDVEIDRLRAFSSKACSCVADAIANDFVEGASGEYLSTVRFGEVSAPNAAVVLAHDLSEELCEVMSGVEGKLAAIACGVSNRRVTSLIWRPAARRLDDFFVDSVLLQSFTGGQRSGVSAASSANEYMIPTSAARMARQLAHDATVLVDMFSSVCSAPQVFLPRCADAARLLQLAARRVLRPRAPTLQEDEEVLAAARLGDDDGSRALRARSVLRALSGREARECLVVAGMYDEIPLE